ncbi:17169_t:CDS:2, partial [Gigaspora rosea]
SKYQDYIFLAALIFALCESWNLSGITKYGPHKRQQTPISN